MSGNKPNGQDVVMTKTVRPLGLYLAELRARTWLSRQPLRKLLGSVAANTLKDTTPLPGKKVRS